MAKIQNQKDYDLQERSYQFAKECRNFVKELPKTIPNIEYSKQLIKSSGSAAANYIEANESLSKKDYFHRVRICRKEAKETRLWLRLCDVNNNDLLNKMRQLIGESIELTKIFGSILEKIK